MKIVIYSLNDVSTKFIYWKKMTLSRKYLKIIHKFCIAKIAPQRWGKTCMRQHQY